LPWWLLVAAAVVGAWTATGSTSWKEIMAIFPKQVCTFPTSVS